MSPVVAPSAVRIRTLGYQPYRPVWQAMQRFTDARSSDSLDELWVVEHPPVFTQGLNGRPEHLLDPGEIEVVPVDRGGQVTYHGPGQLVIYLLLDLKRLGLGVRALVSLIEESIIALLAERGISAVARREAPGVYVAGRKIAALGLRVRRGRSFHGLSLNVDMDLAPFARINPCGYADLEVTQLADFEARPDLHAMGKALINHLCQRLKLSPSGPVEQALPDIPQAAVDSPRAKTP